MLDDCLKKLNDLVDLDHLAASEQRMFSAVSYEPVDRLPVVMACPVPGWPASPYRECFADREKMLLSELTQAWVGVHVKDDRMYMIRANYGVGTVASMFGCRPLITHDDLMPWAQPLSDVELDTVLEKGEVDVESGLGARVLETERFYLETLSRFDKLAHAIHVYVCDIQGPFDIAHLVMGSRIYTEIYDRPERVRRLLELASDAFVRFTRVQKRIIGEDSATSFHTGMKVRGAVRLCDDSGTNLSGPMYCEFSKPYNERALAGVGGGWIHYCGDGSQILDAVLGTSGVTALNFGNPERQDIERVMRGAVSRKIALLLWRRDLPLPEWVDTGVVLGESAPDLDSATKAMRAVR